MPSPHTVPSNPPVDWSTHLSVRLLRSEKTRLEQLARQRGRSVSELLRDVIQTLFVTEEEAAAMNGKIHTDNIAAMPSPRAASPVR